MYGPISGANTLLTSMNVIDKIKYGIENFQGIRLQKTSHIIPLIRNDIDNIIAYTGVPGAGKGGISKKVGSHLGIRLKNKYEDNSNLLELGITHEETGLHFLYVILDCFFKEIGTRRYKEMLENSENFLEMFSDDEKAVEFVRNILHNHEAFQYEGAYLKTDIERELSKAMSSLYVRGREEGANTTILLDGVNSFNIADIVTNQIGENRLNVIKILIAPRLGLSFQRIIKRDVIGNGKKKTKDLDVVTKFRLEEAIHLFENFTIPALFDKDAYMIDYTQKTDHELTLQQKKDVKISLIKNGGILFSEKKGEFFDDYLESYITLLIEHLNHS